MDTSKPDDADFVEPPGEVWVAQTELTPGAVSLTGAIMQNVTHIAPAIAAFLFTTTIVGNAGGKAPLAYLIGFLIVLALGMCLVQLAKHFPSAGGYFTYVSSTIGPRSGWLTGWMFALYSPIVAGPILAFLGLIFEGEFQSNWDWTWFHWWMMVIIFLPIITLDRLRRDLHLRAHDRGRRSARVPDRARTRPVGTVRSRPGRLHLQRLLPELRPGEHHRRLRLPARGRVHRAGADRLGSRGAARRGDGEPAPQRAHRDDGLDRDRRCDARARLLGTGRRLGHEQPREAAELRGDPGAHDRPSRVGRLLGARADRDVHLGDRRESRVSERGHSHVVRDGARRRAARGLRQGASRRARRRPPRSRRSSSCRWRWGSSSPSGSVPRTRSS